MPYQSDRSSQDYSSFGNQPYIGEERRRAAGRPDGWHLKKEVNLTIILTLVGMAITGFWGFADLKKDVELIKADNYVLHQRDTQNSNDLRDALTDIRAQYKDISDRLNRLLESDLVHRRQSTNR